MVNDQFNIFIVSSSTTKWSTRTTKITTGTHIPTFKFLFNLALALLFIFLILVPYNGFCSRQQIYVWFWRWFLDQPFNSTSSRCLEITMREASPVDKNLTIMSVRALKYECSVYIVWNNSYLCLGFQVSFITLVILL